MDHIDGVEDSLCVGQRLPGGDERVVLFVKMNPGEKFTREFVAKVKAIIRAQLSARHVPSVVMETTDIPVSLVHWYRSPICTCTPHTFTVHY